MKAPTALQFNSASATVTFSYSKLPMGGCLGRGLTVHPGVAAAAGITPDRVFTDTASGRAGSNRPSWTECMGDDRVESAIQFYLREGDHLVVVAVDRLGRSVREVASALHELTTRGVHVRSLREGVDTSTPNIADVGSGYVGHSRGVLSAPPEAIRVPSGLNATLYTSGYVACVYGGFGARCRKPYDFVPYMDLPDGWCTKDGNSYCSEHWPMVRR